MFAPAHHGATRYVIPVRRELAVRTIFNFLGPLTNPAGATRQLIGVSDPGMIDTMAAALARLGATRALVVSSEDGLDELSTSAPTRVVEVNGEQIDRYSVTAADCGLAEAPPEAVAGGHPADNARTTRAILAGEPGAAARPRRAQRRRRDLRRRRRGLDRRRRRARARGDRLRRRGPHPRRLRGAQPQRMNTLEAIVDATRNDLRRRRKEVPLAELERRLDARGQDRPFSEALIRPGVSVIAEHKRRSPSAGEIRPGSSVTEIVQAYERGGAAALSILTEPGFFGGSLDDLREARAASRLPILRKDFIVDPYQVYESAALGADALLLIVAAISKRELADLFAEARSLDLDVLVEVHDAEELDVRAGGPRRRRHRHQQPQPRRLLRRHRPDVRAARRRAGGQDGHLRVGLPRRASSSTSSSASASTPCSSASRSCARPTRRPPAAP